MGQKMQDIGKMLLGLGLLLVLIGALVLLAARTGLPLGRLPGDISYKGKNFSVYIPLATSILISIVLSVLLYIVSRFRR
jgi:heme/copper-type cytochrome/quinol oxidase subunit 2